VGFPWAVVGVGAGLMAIGEGEGASKPPDGSVTLGGVFVGLSGSGELLGAGLVAWGLVAWGLIAWGLVAGRTDGLGVLVLTVGWAGLNGGGTGTLPPKLGAVMVSGGVVVVFGVGLRGAGAVF
jgi:hypothetical protein